MNKPTCMLEITGPDGSVKRLRFAHSPILFGRQDHKVDVYLDDPLVSRIHGEIVLHRGGVEVKDNGSTNGTRTEEGRQKGPFWLEVGEHFTAGCYRIQVAAMGHTGALEKQIRHPVANWDVDSKTPVALATVNRAQIREKEERRKVELKPASGAY
ncbi:MAG: pSer/pThr/pTyr-binding forkhead associated (FHA) protein [Myxococcota bacterium]|jgi:pSer/pThr/pTyr-binding forkhead associated (FHA) protein